MIKAFRKWVARIVHDELSPAKAIPTPVASGMPLIQIYKINNGYIYHKTVGPYRDDGATVLYCATPMDVARQIVNSEALQKMGIQAEQMHTTGQVSAKLGTQANPVPTL